MAQGNPDPKQNNPKIEFTERQIKHIGKMAGNGMTVQQMSDRLGVSKKTFERRMKENTNIADAVKKGRSEGVDQMTGRAFAMGMSGKYPAFTMFWLKCRAGWKENDTSLPDTQQVIINYTEKKK